MSGYTQEQAHRLHVLLMEAMGEYVEHQSWRCEHPPHFYMTEEARALVADGDCACGLLDFQKRVSQCLAAEGQAAS